MFVIKGGKSVPRGHVRLKSPPSESHRYEIQPDTLDLPPLSHPSAGPRGNPAQGPKTTRKRVAPFGTWAPVQWGVVSPVPLTI